jgi:hypothetical protein
METKNKLLIIGDSFAAIYPNNRKSWHFMLQASYKVTNVAQAGVSEYKILKQLQSVVVDDFDYVIVCHTSPYRVHTNSSIHKTQLHKNCDLLYKDVEAKRWSFNPVIRSAYGYFMHHYDPEYYEDVYSLIRNEIKNNTPNDTLHIDHFDIPKTTENNKLNLIELWNNNKGNTNHYSDKGNFLVYRQVKEKLDEIHKTR